MTYHGQSSLESTSNLVVDSGRNTLDTTAASQTANASFRDALNVVAQDLAIVNISRVAHLATVTIYSYRWRLAVLLPSPLPPTPVAVFPMPAGCAIPDRRAMMSILEGYVVEEILIS
jgi:hypothetical protein